jgi:hypothetical protein
MVVTMTYPLLLDPLLVQCQQKDAKRWKSEPNRKGKMRAMGHGP